MQNPLNIIICMVLEFSGWDTKHVIGKMLIHKLTPNGIALLPSQLIHWAGGLQPFATSFLFRPSPTTALTSLFSKAKAAHTLAAGPSRVTAILAHADLHWWKLNSHCHFGKTFCSPSPSIWQNNFWASTLSLPLPSVLH